MSGEFSSTDLPPPIFCPKRLLRHMEARGSRAVAVMEVVQSIITRGRTPIDQARSAINQGQLPCAAQTFHHLKGCVANLGGMRVYELADQLERGLDQDVDPIMIEQLISCIEREFDAFIGEARKWLQQEEALLLPNFDADRSTEDQKLAELVVSLKENNFNACEIFEQMHFNLKRTLPNSDFKALNLAISELAFERALEYLPQPEHPPKRRML